MLQHVKIENNQWSKLSLPCKQNLQLLLCHHELNTIAFEPGIQLESRPVTRNIPISAGLCAFSYQAEKDQHSFLLCSDARSVRMVEGCFSHCFCTFFWAHLVVLWLCGYDGGGLLSPKQWLQSSPLGRQLCESSLGLLQQRNNSTCMKKLPKQRHAMTLGHF